MVYEIVNPSDRYTIEGELEAAAVATVLLGGGMYALEDPDDRIVLPVFFGATPDRLDHYWHATFGRGFHESATALTLDVIAALESVLIGSRAERKRLERVLAAISSPAEREAARAAWHDGRRTSQNDIGAAAARYARTMRARAAQARSAP